MDANELETAVEAARALRVKRNAMTGPCGSCSGTGYIGQFSHVSGGVCFSCEGRGRVLPRSKRDLNAAFVLETELAELEGKIAAHNAVAEKCELPDLNNFDLSAFCGLNQGK